MYLNIRMHYYSGRLDFSGFRESTVKCFNLYCGRNVVEVAECVLPVSGLGLFSFLP